ncbi:WG repeat-containing protein [Culturomica massiliensis]|uniref:WG repeat-containing protein n=1 Tax=Culturomica massiliensis TaxID=1841857 RepID=UPI00033F739C|nr:WG repeat-containing protein [Culturomica massiliensis]CCZ08418.1 unknown [Odoribacter sp. CAG:788]
MKTTKIFVSVLLGIMSLALSSCNSPEYRPTDGNCSFIIKKIDGKRQWGIVHKSGKTEYIPCQYDSIFSAYNSPYYIKDLFIGVKNGKMYALDTWRGELLGGRGFTSLVSSKQKAPHNKSVSGGGPLFEEAKTDEGIMFFYLPTGTKWVEFGPAEAVLWGGTILSKKNGKWGILWGKDSKKYLSPITPYIYDAVISVRGQYFWVKKDGKWSAIDLDGKPVRKSQSLLNKYLSMPSMDNEEYQRKERSALFRKISIQEASYISVSWTEADYISW